MELTVEIYKLTKLLPREELYGLTSQIRRSIISIPSNIAEGFHRAHQREQAQFMHVAYASGAELETQIELCKKLKLLTPEACLPTESILAEVMRMLNTINQKLSR